MAPKIHFGQDAFLIHIRESHILVGNGPGFMDVEIAATVKADGIEEKKNIGDIIATKKKEGIIVRLPDTTISYVYAAGAKPKEYEADVLVLTTPDEKLISKIRPKLCVLMNSTLYDARELHKKTGVQVIAAQHGLTIDLSDYNAMSQQKALSQFTTKEE
ncbi:MAG: hypothetical protein QW165_02710 [Candidatus Woesearchaeota archaeon]